MKKVTEAKKRSLNNRVEKIIGDIEHLKFKMREAGIDTMNHTGCQSANNNLRSVQQMINRS